jgi:uncharacterized membrane protein YdjX (TVP38/TMEM64 family)
MDARHWPKIILAVAFVAVVAWLFASGQAQGLTAEQLRDELRASGTRGMVLFVLAFTFVQPLGVSGHLFVVAAGLVWPPFVAFGLSMGSVVVGHSLAFLFYRYVAQEWAQKRVPKRLARFEEMLAARPFVSVLLLRLPTFTWALSTLVLGVSRVRYWPMIVATALGIIPLMVLDIWLGGSLSSWLGG